MQNPITLQNIKSAARTAGLRPQPNNILLPEPQVYPHSKHHNLAGKLNAWIHCYWNEIYFDNLQCEHRKLGIFTQELGDIIKLLPNYISHQWGASDGHLFCIIDLNP